MPLIDAIDVANAEWGLVGDEALASTGDEGKVIFRAVHYRHGSRHTSFFEPQEVLHVLNSHLEEQTDV